MLKQTMEPSNAIITLVAKENAAQATNSEPIYGTKYGTLQAAREFDAWRSSAVPPELTPPLPNPFIPKDFTIKCGGGASCLMVKKEAVRPRLLRDAPGIRVHFLQDQTFRRPKAFAFFLFRSNLLYSSPKASVTAQLFQAVLADTLQDATCTSSAPALQPAQRAACPLVVVSWPCVLSAFAVRVPVWSDQAGLAGLGASLGAEYNGLALSASGYNSRLPALVKYVGEQVPSARMRRSSSFCPTCLPTCCCCCCCCCGCCCCCCCCCCFPLHLTRRRGRPGALLRAAAGRL